MLSLVGCFLALILVESVIEIYQTIPFPSMIAGYTLASRISRRRAILVGLVLAPVVLVNLAVVTPHTFWSVETPKNLAFVALPVVLGIATRNRHDYLAALVDRAETAERTREEEARRRVDEERLRIARDLHDLVAHALVAINVQAGVAAHVRDPDPETNRRTFRDIKQVSGDALADLRGTLGLLRGSDESAPTAPTAGLADLSDLAARLEGTGVDLTLRIDLGAAGTAPLPTAVDATGYRIVQEALTNVMRHAAPTRALVDVRREDGAVVLEVSDDGTADPSARREPAQGSGNGLRGMRERAAVVGGTLDAGPYDGGGWRVVARLPHDRERGRVIRVLLADDQALVRAGFGVLLRAEDGIDVVGEAVDGEQAVALAREHAPDVVLMDIRMPRLDGLEATARIVADPALPETRVVVLTTFELDEYVFGALRAGASGFLLKDIEPAALVEAIRTVAGGEALLAPRVTRTLIEAFVAQEAGAVEAGTGRAATRPPPRRPHPP